MKLFIWAAIACLYFSSVASAENRFPRDEKACIQVIKGCFAMADEDRTHCFYNGAKNSVCQGTELGRLSFKRWSMSPSRVGGEDAPSAFLGPQLIDQSCLEKFDSQLSSELIRGSLAKERAKNFDSLLDSCKRDTSLELLRP